MFQIDTFSAGSLPNLYLSHYLEVNGNRSTKLLACGKQQGQGHRLTLRVQSNSFLAQLLAQWCLCNRSSLNLTFLPNICQPQAMYPPPIVETSVGRWHYYIYMYVTDSHQPLSLETWWSEDLETFFYSIHV